MTGWALEPRPEVAVLKLNLFFVNALVSGFTSIAYYAFWPLLSMCELCVHGGLLLMLIILIDSNSLQ